MARQRRSTCQGTRTSGSNETSRCRHSGLGSLLAIAQGPCRILPDRPKRIAEIGIPVYQDILLVLQESVEGIGEISSELLHERIAKRRRTCGQMDTARSQFHDEQDIKGNQATLLPNFNGREINGRQNLPMRFDERVPRCLPFASWRRFDSVLLEYIADGRIQNTKAKVGQGALDSVAAPRRILRSKS